MAAIRDREVGESKAPKVEPEPARDGWDAWKAVLIVVAVLAFGVAIVGGIGRDVAVSRLESNGASELAVATSKISNTITGAAAWLTCMMAVFAISLRSRQN